MTFPRYDVQRASATFALTCLLMLLGVTHADGRETGSSEESASTIVRDASRSVRYKTANVEGIRIFYREAGDPARPTVLLLHGFSSSSHMFRDLMPLLAERFYLIAPDYPGFGHSDAPDAATFTPTFANLTVIIEKLVQQLGLKSFVVYMQDFGGPVGLRMAVRHPEWITGLIVQNANAYMEGFPPEQGAAMASEPRVPMSARVVTPEFIRFMYRNGARNVEGLNPDAWTLDIAVLQKPEAKRIQAALIDDYHTNLPLYAQWQAYLRKSQPKILIVWGKNDRGFLPAGAQAFQKDVPSAELHFFDTGHFALEEDAVAIARTILRRF